MDNFWQACSAQLEQELTPQQFNAWIKPLAPLDFEEGLLRIAAPNRFKLDWVKTQFANRIHALATQHWDGPIEVQFVLDPRTNAAKKPATSMSATFQPGSPQQASMPHAFQDIPVETMTPRREQSRINPDLTFDSFVTGKANRSEEHTSELQSH